MSASDAQRSMDPGTPQQPSTGGVEDPPASQHSQPASNEVPSSQTVSDKPKAYVPPALRNRPENTVRTEPRSLNDRIAEGNATQDKALEANTEKTETCVYWWQRCCRTSAEKCTRAHRLFDGRMRKRVYLDDDCPFADSGKCIWPARLCFRRHDPSSAASTTDTEDSADWTPVTSGVLCKRCDIYFADPEEMKAHLEGDDWKICKASGFSRIVTRMDGEPQDG